MTAPTQISEDDAKQAYLKRCMDMTHGQLYAELMRVHKEATALVQMAVEQERKECAYLVMQGTDNPMQVDTLKILQAERLRLSEAIKARGGNHGLNS